MKAEQAARRREIKLQIKHNYAQYQKIVKQQTANDVVDDKDILDDLERARDGSPRPLRHAKRPAKKEEDDDKDDDDHYRPAVSAQEDVIKRVAKEVGHEAIKHFKLGPTTQPTPQPTTHPTTSEPTAAPTTAPTDRPTRLHRAPEHERPEMHERHRRKVWWGGKKGK